MEAADKEKSIEDIFEQLEKLAEKMEDGETSLEASFACYEEGIRLLREAEERIDKVEQKFVQLSTDGKTPEEEAGDALPFEPV